MIACINGEMSLTKKQKTQKSMVKLRKILSKPAMTIAKALMKYKCNPCLWNVRHMFYRHSAVKSSAWNEVVKVWREIEPNANEIYVKFKVSKMRSTYRHQQKIFEERKITDTSYKPTLYYYHHFDFLPSPRKIPKYSDQLQKIVVLPDAAQNQPKNCAIRRMANNMVIKPKLQQPVRYAIAPVATLNRPAQTATCSGQLTMATTNAPALMATTNAPVQTTNIIQQVVMITTNKPALMDTTNTPAQTATTSQQIQIATYRSASIVTTNGSALTAITTEHIQMAVTNRSAVIATTNGPAQTATPSGQFQAATTNKPALINTINEPAQAASSATGKESSGNQDPSSNESWNYLLVVERDNTNLKYVAYELDENAVTTFMSTYSGDQKNADK